MAQMQIEFDNKHQLERIQALVSPPELLYAVFDEKGVGTGFVGITDRRIIFLDQDRVRKSKTILSLPYSKMTAVGSEDTGRGLFSSSKLLVFAGTREWVFEFQTNQKAHRVYELIMWNLLQNERAGMMR